MCYREYSIGAVEMQSFSCYYNCMEKQIKTVTIRIAMDILEEMRAIAQQHDRSLNGEILTALRDYVARHKRSVEGEAPPPSNHVR